MKTDFLQPPVILTCMGTECIAYLLTNPAMPEMVKIGKTAR